MNEKERALECAAQVMDALQTYGNFVEFNDCREPDGRNAGVKNIIADAILGGVT
jgi:hypothetical protein